LLLIKNLLLSVGLPQADDPKIIHAGRDDYGVKPLTNHAEDEQARFTIVPPGVFPDKRRLPVDFRCKLEGKAALCDVPLIFAGSKLRAM
jgi:hypothetical protein